MPECQERPYTRAAAPEPCETVPDKSPGRRRLLCIVDAPKRRPPRAWVPRFCLSRRLSSRKQLGQRQYVGKAPVWIVVLQPERPKGRGVQSPQRYTLCHGGRIRIRRGRTDVPIANNSPSHDRVCEVVARGVSTVVRALTVIEPGGFATWISAKLAHGENQRAVQ